MCTYQCPELLDLLLPLVKHLSTKLLQPLGKGVLPALQVRPQAFHLLPAEDDLSVLTRRGHKGRGGRGRGHKGRGGRGRGHKGRGGEGGAIKVGVGEGGAIKVGVGEGGP